MSNKLGIALAAGVAALAILSGRLPAADKPAQWEPVGLCGGGGLFNPAVSPHDPKTMLTESDMGGRYISYDGGATWAMIHHKQVTAACRGGPPLFHPTKPGIIYALSEFGANHMHVSRDNGKSWREFDPACQPKTDVITRMFIDPALPDRLFIGTQAGKLFYTDNEGKQWSDCPGIEGRVYDIVVQQASPADKRVYAVGSSAGVFRSDDGGKSFSRRTEGLPAGKQLTGFAGGSNDKATILYAATPCWLEGGKLAGGVYASKDLGNSWQRVMNPKINLTTSRTSEWAAGDLPHYSFLACNNVKPERAYVWCGGTSYFPPNHNTVYRTDDAGAAWADVWFVDPRVKECNVAPDWMTSYMHQSWTGRPLSMEISPTDPDMLMRADGMWIHWTRDAGKSWVCGYAVKASNATADKDITWKNNGVVETTTWNYYIDPHEPKRHYIAYTDIGFARSTDAGQSWRWWGPGAKFDEKSVEDFPIPRGWINTTYELAFDPDIPGKIWGAFSGSHDIPNENAIWRSAGAQKGGHGGVAVTLDFGTTWKPCKLPENPTLAVVLDPKSPKGKRTLYAALYDLGVFKSTDDGATWVEKSKGLGDPADMRVCRLILHRDGTLFCLITGMRSAGTGTGRDAIGPFIDKGVGLYRSKDGAESWEKLNAGYPLLYPKDFGVDPDNSSVIYMGACDAPGSAKPQGGLHRTTDGGKTWSLVIRKRATHFGAYFHPKKKGWIYATGNGWSAAPEGGLWLSKDNGQTWTELGGLPFAGVHRVHFDPANEDVIYVTTFGGSVWKGPAE